MDQIQMFIRQAQQELQSKGNQGIPVNTLDKMYSQNPEAAKQVQDLLASGKNPQQAALEIMQRMGINPNTLFRR